MDIIIYRNAYLMLGKYRKTLNLSPALENSRIETAANIEDYIVITGETQNGESLFVHIFMKKSVFMDSSLNIKNLLKIYDGKNKPINLILISAGSNSIHISREITKFKQKNPNVYLEMLKHTNFVTECPIACGVPKHSIATREEIDLLQKIYHLEVEYLPRILATDVQAVWLGARPGQIIKIIRPSPTSGYSLYYRIVVE